MPGYSVPLFTITLVSSGVSLFHSMGFSILVVDMVVVVAGVVGLFCPQAESASARQPIKQCTIFMRMNFFKLTKAVSLQMLNQN